MAREPLTEPDCDLTDFPFMAMDVARLRDSELASSEAPEACWAALLLWCTSWHQVPAASIPNDDKWIAKHAGYAQRGKIDKSWSAVRAGALHGWVECDDGRLYHPVVAEKARNAWQAKLLQRWRTECARIKKHNDRKGAKVKLPTFDDWESAGRPQGHSLVVPDDKLRDSADVPEEAPAKRQRHGQREGDLISVANATAVVAGTWETGGSTSPEAMPMAELWRVAIAVLREGGCRSEEVSRSFMGKLAKDYSAEIVREAVSAAATAQPIDARAYIKATCARLKAERASDSGRALTTPSKAADQTAAELADRKRRADEIEAEDTPERRRARTARLTESRIRLVGASPAAVVGRRTND